MPNRIERQVIQYKARLDKAVADGKVTRAEADAFIRDAKDGRFTQLQAHYLSGFVDRKTRSYEPEARERLLRFVQEEMVAYATIDGDHRAGKPRAQPKMADGSEETGRVQYKHREGTLTVNGFGADDVLQGQIGDCYFLTSLSAVAQHHPDLLAKAVKTNRDGTYTVTFFEKEPGKSRAKKVEITVDTQFAMRGKSLEYAAARETRELWPLIFEKAYAAWKGGYDAIESGMAATALESLTGAKADFFPVTSASDPAATFTRLKAACANKGCVVALTKTWDPSESGLIADHAYTLLGVEERGGERFVKLRNPWGFKEPGEDRKDDGIFSMPLSKFLTSFATVEFAHPK